MGVPHVEADWGLAGGPWGSVEVQLCRLGVHSKAFPFAWLSDGHLEPNLSTANKRERRPEAK